MFTGTLDQTHGVADVFPAPVGKPVKQLRPKIHGAKQEKL